MKRVVIISAAVLVFFANPAFSENFTMERAKEYKANIPVSITKKIQLPRSYHEGLFFDGENIWVSNGEGGDTWIIDPGTGSMISQIEPAGKFTEAIVGTGDGSYWMTDWNAQKLYRVEIENNKMIIKSGISLEPAHPAGVVRAGERLFVITWTRGLGTKYHLLEFDAEGVLVKKVRIKRIHEPSQLAWDGSHLWISSWYSQMVYKIDINSFSILSSFKSPAPKTTGIVWDGKHLWVTGTYADLYKLEVDLG